MRVDEQSEAYICRLVEELTPSLSDEQVEENDAAAIYTFPRSQKQRGLVKE